MKHRDYMRELLKMSDEAIMEALGAKEFHRDLAQKYVDGAEFISLTTGGRVLNPKFTGFRDSYLEKPKTIKITFEVPKPLSVTDYISASLVSQTYYTYLGGKAIINFHSNEDREAFFSTLLKAVEEAMQQ